jgi:sulfur carrier protein
MEVSIGSKKRTVDVRDGETYEDLLLSLNLNPEEYIVIVDGKPVPLESEIKEGETKILKVVSGG